MAQGILFGAGLIIGILIITLSIVVLIGLLRTTKSSRPTVAMWKEYLDTVLQEQDYYEAAFVRNMIEGRPDDTRTPLPKGYVIRRNRDTVMNLKNVGEVSIHTTETSWIEKVKSHK